MKLYLAPEPSLELTRYLRSVNGADGLAGTPLRKRSLADAINSVRGIDELDHTAHMWLSHAGTPIQAYVNHRSKGTSTKRLVTHVLASGAPNGAMLDLGHDVCMCSPRFMFMQLAMQLDTVDLARVGMELCGTYSLWRLAPDRFGDLYSRMNGESQSCTYDVPRATKLHQLQAFVGRQQNARGAVGARSALRWIGENSASPMETAIYLLLCLPKRLGGYGLPKPVLNPKLIVSNPHGSVERYPDLFWLGANIDVEYNSDSAHSGEWSRYRDSKREIELTVGNIKVLPLTRPQVMNSDEFDAFAQGLRRMLGIRARATDPKWAYRHEELREKLLAGWN